MDQKEFDSYIKAGKIAKETLEYAKTLIKKGNSLTRATIEIENKIRSLGGELAFPAQFSLNEVAAHFYPDNEDIIFEDQLVKIDVGVHVNGFIGDTALTIDLSNKWSDLVKASREALDNAIKITAPGVKIRDIGKTISETIESYGFKPIRNLNGHGLSRYNIHDAPTIPNYDNKDEEELTEDQVIAIEPFATNGEGLIKESINPRIFSLYETRQIRSPISREVLGIIEKEYKTLPFAKRWLQEKISPVKVNFALNDLAKNRNIVGHPPLPEVKKGFVSQAEHSIIVRDKPVIFTR